MDERCHPASDSSGSIHNTVRQVIAVPEVQDSLSGNNKVICMGLSCRACFVATQNFMTLFLRTQDMFSLRDTDDELCDLEVQHYMQDYIRRDKCICSKYRNSITSKACPCCLRLNPETTANETYSNNNHTVCKDDNDSLDTPKLYTLTEARCRPRSKRKRKPKLIPASDFIAKYYFPSVMRYENLTLPQNKMQVQTKYSSKGSTPFRSKSKSSIRPQKQIGHSVDEASYIIKAMSDLSV